MRRIPGALCAAMFLIAAVFPSAGALAQSTGIYPQRPVRIVVPYPPGSGTDIVARLLGQRIGEHWGQPVVVENRPGAGAIVGVDTVAKAAPDGYTIGIADTGPFAINPALYPKLPYDPVRDFTPVIELAKLPFMLVAHPSLGVSSVAELIAKAKREPGRINYASVGNGSSVQLATELFKKQAGIDLVHIPYKGSAPASTDLLGGQLQMMFHGLHLTLPYITTNRLRALGVTSPQRSAMAPQLPTLDESGLPGFKVNAWYGVMAPAGTPKAIVEQVNAALLRNLNAPGMKQRLANQGMVAVGSTPDELALVVREELQVWSRVIKESGAKID